MLSAPRFVMATNARWPLTHARCTQRDMATAGGPRAGEARDAIGVLCARFTAAKRPVLVKFAHHAKSSALLFDAIRGGFPGDDSVAVSVSPVLPSESFQSLSVLGCAQNPACEPSVRSVLQESSIMGTVFMAVVALPELSGVAVPMS